LPIALMTPCVDRRAINGVISGGVKSSSLSFKERD
jgi:hypothetical protein